MNASACPKIFSLSYVILDARLFWLLAVIGVGSFFQAIGVMVRLFRRLVSWMLLYGFDNNGGGS